MGKTVTYKYALKIRDGEGWHASSWIVKTYGAANDESLRKYVFQYADSLKAGGVNAHLAQGLGYVPYPYEAVVADQRTGQVVARWKQAAFQVF